MPESLLTTEPAAPQLEELEAAAAPQAVTDTELLQLIADNSAKQCAYAKKQLGLVRWCTSFIGLLLALAVVAAGLLAPRIDSILKQANEVLANGKIVSEKLAEVDYPALIASIDALIATGDTGITQALANVESALAVIEQFDIDTLNSAISDLNKVVAPIAKMFGG